MVFSGFPLKIVMKVQGVGNFRTVLLLLYSSADVPFFFCLLLLFSFATCYYDKILVMPVASNT